jgi:diadenosine tetraphosphatase ApaH/serine/threonine PP2A family protein phosphatase
VIAIVSDIHGNLEALEAVLLDIEEKGLSDPDIYCLGDVIGYGPNPRECLQRAMGFRACLLGNHEEALLTHPDDFNEKARQAIDWTRDQLNDPEADREINYGFWNFLGSLPRSLALDERVHLVHASPRQPTREYVMPRDIKDVEKMKAIFAHQTTSVCFCGHTHYPGIFGEDLTFVSPHQDGNRFELDERRVLINVGSVGQPRDGDPRACYVTFEGSVLEYHRVPYDFVATQRKIARTEALPNFLAARLAKGR